MAKFVKSAIVFGYGRPCLGVILELHEPSQALDAEQLDTLRCALFVTYPRVQG